MTIGRPELLKQGLRLQVLTIAWMLLETTVTAIAGVMSRSVLLLAVAAGSAVDLFSSCAVYYLFRAEQREPESERIARLERWTARGVGAALMLAAVFVLAVSIFRLLNKEGADGSYVGIAIATIAALWLPGLARKKMNLAQELNSAALRADGISTLFCGLMSQILVVGLLADMFLRWWWLDASAALLLVPLLVKEGYEAMRAMPKAFSS